MYWPRRIIERRRDARQGRKRSGTRCEMQEFAAGKFHLGVPHELESPPQMRKASANRCRFIFRLFAAANSGNALNVYPFGGLNIAKAHYAKRVGSRLDLIVATDRWARPSLCRKVSHPDDTGPGGSHTTDHHLWLKPCVRADRVPVSNVYREKNAFESLQD